MQFLLEDTMKVSNKCSFKYQFLAQKQNVPNGIKLPCKFHFNQVKSKKEKEKTEEIINSLISRNFMESINALLLYSRHKNRSRNIINHNIRTSMNEQTHFFINIK